MLLLHKLAWLAVAAGVVVEDRGYTSTSTVYAALDLGPQRFVVAVALKATAAEIETTATTFCREHRADIASLAPGLDGAWAAQACAGLVRGAIHDALAPRSRASDSRLPPLPTSLLAPPRPDVPGPCRGAGTYGSSSSKLNT